MRCTALFAALLACLCLAVGCDGPTPKEATPVADPVDTSSLPGPGPSWIAGSRSEPVGGRVVVGLLVGQRTQRRLADLIPADKLQAYLVGEVVALEQPEADSVSFNPSYRAWGKQGGRLLGVARAWRDKCGVEVLFREVLAEECAELPLLLVGAGMLHAHERRALKAHRQRGGRIVRFGRAVVSDKQLSPAALLEQRLADVIADSPLVQVLPVDPLAAEARREGDDIVLRLPQAGTLVVLEDAAGRSVASARTDADRRVRLHAPDPELDPFAHHIVVHWEGAGMALSRATSLAELVGTVELRFSASEKVHAGGVLAVRVEAKLADVAAVDRKGRVELVRDEQVLAAADYLTDDSGLAHPRLAVPIEVKPGPAVLRCDGLVHALEITSGLRLSVVTDRPLYKQTDKVHVRLMAHRAGDGRPVGGQQVELSIGEAKRKVTTSEHGIASHTFELAGARVGSARVKAVGGGAKARCRFRVKAFERPTFTVRADPAELLLRPGEAATVRIQAAYVNGSPFVGGQVWFRARKLKLEGEPKRFDAQGGARLTVRAPSTLISGGLYISVQDVEGRRVDCHVPVRLQRDGPALGAWRLSDLALGVPARFLIRCSDGGRVRLGGAFDGPRTVDLGTDEHAVVSLTPKQEQFLLRVVPLNGTAYERTFKARRPQAGGLLMALDRRTGRVGETLRIALRGAPGLVHVDIWKDETAVRLLSARLDQGGADLDLHLDASLAGVLQVFARRADQGDGVPRATVLITRGRALQVTAAARQESYVPGATAEVDVTVRDHAGEPTAAVLGYWGVDEALLAIAPMEEGHETVFDVATSHADGPERALAAKVDDGARVTAGSILSLFPDGGRGQPTRRKLAIELERTPLLVRAALETRVQRVGEGVRRIWDAYGAAWKDMPLADLVTSDSVRETLQWLVRNGRLDPRLLLDPWSSPYRLWSDRYSVAIVWESAGPDRVFETPDDVMGTWNGRWLYEQLPKRIRDFHRYVQVHYREPLDEDRQEPEGEVVIRDADIFDAMETDNDPLWLAAEGEALTAIADWGLGAAYEGPTSHGVIGIGGGAGGAFKGRGGGRDLGTGGGGGRAYIQAPVHLRKDFDPTLCFVPETIVGPDGQALLRIPLKDSMTTWRLRLVASNPAGAVGVGGGTIRVKQPVHAAPWLAPHLTVGDVVDVPVAVRNEEGHAVEADVALSVPSGHLELLSGGRMTLSIPAQATGRALFRLRALRAGRAPVLISVATGHAQDHQERVLSVHPDARRVVAVTSGSVTADMAFPTSMPRAGPGEVRMDLYPSPLAEIVSGFDGLIRAPHG